MTTEIALLVIVAELSDLNPDGNHALDQLMIYMLKMWQGMSVGTGFVPKEPGPFSRQLAKALTLRNSGALARPKQFMLADVAQKHVTDFKDFVRITCPPGLMYKTWTAAVTNACYYDRFFQNDIGRKRLTRIIATRASVADEHASAALDAVLFWQPEDTRKWIDPSGRKLA